MSGLQKGCAAKCWPDWKPKQYEQKYGMRSEVFYALIAGTPAEDQPDFLQWAWRLIKYRATRELAQLMTMDTWQSTSRQKKQERPVWQRRFWEHTVRDEDEFSALCDYIHPSN